MKSRTTNTAVTETIYGLVKFIRFVGFLLVEMALPYAKIWVTCMTNIQGVSNEYAQQ